MLNRQVSTRTGELRRRIRLPRLNSLFTRYLAIVAVACVALAAAILAWDIGGPSPFTRSLAVGSTICVAIAAAILAWATIGRDHFAALLLDGDPSWYRDFGGRFVLKIQELDLFYHNIGQSIACARKADIVVLGSSFVLYALDGELLRKLADRYGIKIYNMSFLGVRSGEFSRRIIKRWNLRPKLWIINVDDQYVHFFSSSLDLFLKTETTPITVVNYGRLQGWLAAASRNVQWHFEDLSARWARFVGAQSRAGVAIYRNVHDGSPYLDLRPRYAAADNPAMSYDRDQNCHADPETIAAARDYLADIGGNANFMLVPHSQYCPQQARELAQALGVEAILPADAPYTTVDDGGHFDRKSAVAYTEAFLEALERTAAFQKILSRRS